MNAVVLAAVAAAVLTGALRMLAFVGFPNDQFVPLTAGAQVLLGDWPVRDFVEPGAPLMTFASAAAQAVGGRTLLAEAVLVATAFGVGAALTLIVAQRLSGSLLVGAWAATTEVIAYPRPYSYPKVLLYAAVAGAILGYAERPSRGWLTVLAVLVVVAFLFRHDHGVYLGVAGAAAVFVRHAREGLRRASEALAGWVVRVVALLVPFAAYVGMHTGLGSYLSAGVEFSRIEAVRTSLRWPDPAAHPIGGPDSWAAILFYVFWALPVAVLAVCAARRRELSPAASAVASALVVAAVGVNGGFLRDPLDVRIADAVVPAVLGPVWLAGPGLRGASRRWRTSGLTSVLLVASTLSIGAASVGRLEEQFDRAELRSGAAAVRERAREVVEQLARPYDEVQMPSRLAVALVPFYDYVRSCTAPDARLFVPGFAPEIPYYARRGFAGGVVTLFAGYHSRPAEQDLILTRLRRQRAPLAVIPPDAESDLRRYYPRIHEYLDEHYRVLYDVPVEGYEDRGRVLARRDFHGNSTYGASAWPCQK